MALDMTTALTIKAKVDGLQQLGGLQKGLGGITQQSNSAATAMGRLRGAASGLMGAMRGLLPLIGTGAFAKLAKDNIDSADAMSKLSQRTGIAAPQLDKFRKVAELSDTSIESLGKGFKNLASNMYDASVKGTGPAAEAFNKLGLSITDSNGKLRDTDQVMLDIADKFQQMADGPEKAALAADIFGAKLGDELIPLLNSGGDAVRNMGTSLTQDFADRAAAFNDRLEVMQEKLGDLGLRLTEALMPALEKLVGIMESVATVFSGLPQPVQDLAAGFGAIAIPVAALALPLGAIVSAFQGLGVILGGLGPLLSGLGPILGGLAGAIGPIVTALGTLGKVLVGVFSGPVGWVALAIAAGVAIYTFRDQIGEAFEAIGKVIGDAAAGFKSVFIDPVVEGFQAVVDFINENFIQPISQGIGDLVGKIADQFKPVTDAITAPFKGAFDAVRGIINQILNGIGQAIGGVIRAINNVIRGANNALARLNLPQIPFLSEPQIPQFAEGGVVSGPTLAMVGEGGEPEYIVPQSKAGRFAANWMSGVRGAAAIPRFAEGGMVVPTGANVSIQTGPVTQMNGTNYVTTDDLGAAVQAGVNQTLNLLAGDSRVRRSLGLA